MRCGCLIHTIIKAIFSAVHAPTCEYFLPNFKFHEPSFNSDGYFFIGRLKRNVGISVGLRFVTYGSTSLDFRFQGCGKYVPSQHVDAAGKTTVDAELNRGTCYSPDSPRLLKKASSVPRGTHTYFTIPSLIQNPTGDIQYPQI